MRRSANKTRQPTPRGSFVMSAHLIRPVASARWYKRAADLGDGDALTEWGYCLQHGVAISGHGLRGDTVPCTARTRSSEE